jgi:hypothetical protein
MDMRGGSGRATAEWESNGDRPDQTEASRRLEKNKIKLRLLHTASLRKEE